MNRWICGDDRPPSSRLYLFRRDFDAAAGARLAVRVSADTRYRLFLNGQYVCEGPCQGSEHLHYYEEADLTPFLRAGGNRLEAWVLYATEEVFITAFRYTRPALWMEGELTENDEVREIGTDLSWQCFREEAVELFRGGAEVQEAVAPFERVLGKSRLTPIPTVLFEQPHPERGGYEPYGLRDIYPLAPRPIPQLALGEPTEFVTVGQGEGYIDLDAGAYTTARVELTVSAPEGTQVDLIYAECYGKENRRGRTVEKDLRDAAGRTDFCLCGARDTLICTGEPLHFEPFWYRAFRYLRVSFPKGAQVRILSASYRTVGYPIGREGTFDCPDERLTRMWEVSRNTVCCCAQEQYLDCPYYEQRQYDMDSALEMLFAFRLSADPRLSRKALTELAASQLPDGMLRAHYPSTRVQVIPNFTLFWVLMARDYLLYTGDTETLRQVYPAVVKALEAFEALRDGSGLFRPTRYWNFVDWVPSWERGVPPGADAEPSTVTALMAVAAYRAASEIAARLGRAARAAEYAEAAERTASAVMAHCYDRDLGLFRDTPSGRTYCRHTALWAILSETVTGEAAGELTDRVFDEGLPVEACTFSMNYYLLRALEKAGRYERYAPRLFAGWDEMLEKHCTTWCENPDQPRSECHGWSCAPLYELSRMALGVVPLADGFREAELNPMPKAFGIRSARGRVPTPHGVIRVAWQMGEDGRIRLSYTAPPEVRVRVGDGILVTDCNTK